MHEKSLWMCAFSEFVIYKGNLAILQRFNQIFKWFKSVPVSCHDFTAPASALDLGRSSSLQKGKGSVMRVFLLKRNCFFVNVESTCATTSCKWPLLVRDRDHLFGWQFYNFTTCHRLYLCFRDHLAHGLNCTFAKCPTLTHTTQSMEELLVFCLAIQIFNLELAYYKFSSSSSLWISSRKRPPARRPATKLSLRILGGRLWREAPAVFIFCLCSKPLRTY